MGQVSNNFALNESEYMLYKRLYGTSPVIEAAAHTLLRDLLRIQGVLFLRLAPLKVYESLQRRSSDFDSTREINALYCSRELPLIFNVQSEQVRAITSDLTVYSY